MRPVHLFDVNAADPPNGQTYGTAPDGQRFLFLIATEDVTGKEASVTLVQGWRGLVE